MSKPILLSSLGGVALALMGGAAVPAFAQPGPPAAMPGPPPPGGGAERAVRRGETQDQGAPPMPQGAPPPGGGGPPMPEMPTVANTRYDTVLHVVEGVEQPVANAAALSDGQHGALGSQGIRIASDKPKLNAVLVQGGKSAYTLTGATIDLKGVGVTDFNGTGAGAMVVDGVIILDKVRIETAGATRSATVATDHAIMKVYDSELIARGGPLPTDYVRHIGPGMMEAPAPLGITGTARTNLTMHGAESYFYRTKVVAEGWGALSTDAADGYVYLEANDCDIRVLKSGYGVYADGGAHVTVNRGTIDSATYAGIIAGSGDIRLNGVQAKATRNVVMIHSVMAPTSEIAQLRLKGGSFETGEASVLVKSANADIDFDGVVLKPANGELVTAILNDDPNRTKVAPGEKVHGVRVRMANGAYAGTVASRDDQRKLSLTLSGASLRGALYNVSLTLDSASRWTATATSEVTLEPTIDLSRLDAAKDVTITGHNSGKKRVVRMPSGGSLILD